MTVSTMKMPLALVLSVWAVAAVSGSGAPNQTDGPGSGCESGDCSESESDGGSAPPVGFELEPGVKLLQLTLIVKDEASSIEQVLRSSLPHVDEWYIMDTGSTDGTIEIINRVTAEYPHLVGRLEQEPFVDFATTRNLALERSGTGTVYKFFIDGDWYLDGARELRDELFPYATQYLRMRSQGGEVCNQCLPCFEREAATGDFECGTTECDSCTPTFLMRLLLGSLDYYIPRVVRSDSAAQFYGVVHEVVGPSSPVRLTPASKIVVNATDTNKGHSENRWHRDEGLLEQELEKNPDDTRTAFYLAQTYGLIGKPEKAYHMNVRRNEMGGWEHERYMALWRAGKNAMDVASMGFDVAKARWLEAHAINPGRAEALYSIAQGHKDRGENELCAIYSGAAVRVAYPSPDTLFIEGYIYSYGRYDMHGICAWYGQQYEDGYAAVKKALEYDPSCKHCRKNLEYYKGLVANYDPSLELAPGGSAAAPAAGAHDEL